MLMLEKRYGSLRLEAACALALTGTRINYTMIKNILAAGMDKQISITVKSHYLCTIISAVLNITSNY